MSHLALSNEIVHNVCTDACVKLLNPCPDCATEQIRCVAIFAQCSASEHQQICREYGQGLRLLSMCQECCNTACGPTCPECAVLSTECTPHARESARLCTEPGHRLCVYREERVFNPNTPKLLNSVSQKQEKMHEAAWLVNYNEWNSRSYVCVPQLCKKEN